MQVEQIDREAAASGYFAWCSGNPVIPNRMVAGTADDHSMVQAFARHRHQARAEVERLRSVLEMVNKAPAWKWYNTPMEIRRVVRAALMDELIAQDADLI